jgi:hypothetical protein
MIVAVHQPHYIPWLGYLHRMAKADLFIVLDHVQFERRNYQNRAAIRLEDESRWLTVPVVQVSQKERIIDKRVDNTDADTSRAWGPTHFKTLKYAYRKAPFAGEYLPRIQEIVEARWEKLVDLDLAMLDFLRESFQIHTPLVRSSTLKAEGARSVLLLNLCREVGASAFLGGLGGSRDYLDKDSFDAAGMGVMWQQFQHPEYEQCGEGPFIKGLMALDLLMNRGRAGVEQFWNRTQVTDDERVAA